MSPTRRARVKRRLLSAPYSPIAAYLGFIAWVALPNGIEPPVLAAALPHWLVIMWTICIAVGGTMSPFGLLMGRNRVEASGLSLLAYGAGLWGVTLVAKDSDRLATIALTIAILAMCFIRLYVLRLAREAGQVALTLPAMPPSPPTPMPPAEEL